MNPDINHTLNEVPTNVNKGKITLGIFIKLDKTGSKRNFQPSRRKSVMLAIANMDDSQLRGLKIYPEDMKGRYLEMAIAKNNAKK